MRAVLAKLRRALSRMLERSAPVDPSWSDLGRLDELERAGRPPVAPAPLWTPGELATGQLPARPPRDPWADDPDRTTRRDTYR